MIVTSYLQNWSIFLANQVAVKSGITEIGAHDTAVPTSGVYSGESRPIL